MCLVAHFSSGGRPGQRAAWVQARGRRGQNWPSRRPPPPPLARSFLFFLAPRLVPPRGGGGRGGLPASPCQGLVRKLGQPRAGAEAWRGRGGANPLPPAAGQGQAAEGGRACRGQGRPSLSALCSFSLSPRARPAPAHARTVDASPDVRRVKVMVSRWGVVSCCVSGVCLRARRRRRKRVGHRRRRVARLPRSLARSLSLRFKKGIAAQTAPLPEPFRARPPPPAHTPQPQQRARATRPPTSPPSFFQSVRPPHTHHPAPMAPAPKPRGAPLLSAAAVAKRAKLVADGAAWASNVLSSVLIIFVNKALMGSAGYGFAYGAWARGCRRERGGRGGERAGASAPAFFCLVFLVRPRADLAGHAHAHCPARTDLPLGRQLYRAWNGGACGRAREACHPARAPTLGARAALFFFFFFFFQSRTRKTDTPPPQHAHAHTHTHTHTQPRPCPPCTTSPAPSPRA